jgi:hypothetical protein
LNEPAYFRKRPAVVQAMRWTGKNTEHVTAWAAQASDRPLHVQDGDPPTLAVTTLEGVMRADVGDWIVCGTANELYPVKPAIFTQIYQPLGGQHTPAEFNVELPA